MKKRRNKPFASGRHSPAPSHSEAPGLPAAANPAARWQRAARYVWDKGGARGGRR